MKSILSLSFVILFALSLNAQVGIGTTTPQAALDIDSATDGLLIPRVLLTLETSPLPLTAPAVGELVFNTAVTGTLTPGFYYWLTVGGPWVRIGDTVTPPPPPPSFGAWLLGGNTILGSEVIGTINNLDLVFQRANSQAGRIAAENVYLGVRAGVNIPISNAASVRNVLIGSRALTGGGSTIASNVAIGWQAMINSAAATNNTAIGDSALQGMVTGNGNVAIGVGARLNFNSVNNVAIGNNALQDSRGTGNTAIGNAAGTTITTGTGNIAIGTSAQVANGASSNQLSIGNWIYGSNGNIGIGTNAPTARLSVNGTADKPGGGSWAIFSDRRSKENIENYTNGLNKLMKINPVKFNYKKEFGWGTKTYVGLIAQDIQKVVPSMVTEKEVNDIKDFKEVDPNQLTYILINSIKEQQAIIEKVKQDNKDLKAANVAILKRLEALEAGEVAEATAEVAEKK